MNNTVHAVILSEQLDILQLDAGMSKKTQIANKTNNSCQNHSLFNVTMPNIKEVNTRHS